MNFFRRSILLLATACFLAQQSSCWATKFEDAYKIGIQVLDGTVTNPVLEEFLYAVFAYKYLELEKKLAQEESENDLLFEKLGIAFDAQIHAMACQGLCLAGVNQKIVSLLGQEELGVYSRGLRDKFIQSMDCDAFGQEEERFRESISISKILLWIAIFENLYTQYLTLALNTNLCFKTTLKLANCAFYSYIAHRKIGRSHVTAIFNISLEIRGCHGKSIFKTIPADPYQVHF